MKRIFSLILCIACGWLAVQAQYRVFGHEGTVEYKKQAGNAPAWKTVYNGLLVSGIDSIRVSAESHILMEDIQTGMVYPAKNEGVESVSHLVDKAKRSNAAVLARVNKEIYAGRGKPSATSSTTLSSERMIVNSDSISMIAKHFAWIAAQACSGQPSPQTDGLAFIKKTAWGNLDFIFENKTSVDYHYNVLHVNTRTNTVCLCYVAHPDEEYTACPVSPNGTCSAVMDIFFPDRECDVYVMVVSEFDYDTAMLDFELQFLSTADGEDTGLDVKYMW